MVIRIVIKMNYMKLIQVISSVTKQIIKIMTLMLRVLENYRKNAQNSSKVQNKERLSIWDKRKFPTKVLRNLI